MKKFSIFLSIILILGIVSQANALSFGDEYFVGTITPGGGNLSDEVSQVNNLIGIDLGTTATINGEGYFRSLADFGVMPTVDPSTVDDDNKQEDDKTTFDATGYNYVIGKYDHSNAGVAVWYNADGFDGEVVLPATWYVMLGSKWFNTNQFGLSHTVGMGAAASVPEPATMFLLGTGLLGLAGLRRKTRKL